MDLVILVGSFFVMLFAGFPIAFALLLSALLYMVMFSSGVPLIIIAQQLLRVWIRSLCWLFRFL